VELHTIKNWLSPQDLHGLLCHHLENCYCGMIVSYIASYITLPRRVWGNPKNQIGKFKQLLSFHPIEAGGKAVKTPGGGFVLTRFLLPFHRLEKEEPVRLEDRKLSIQIEHLFSLTHMN
jgi:hypothetical protein